MQNQRINFSFLLTAVIFIMYSCNTNPTKLTNETPTMGNIKIAADDSYQLLTEAELYTFHSFYKAAKITPIYASEDSILKLFLKDSVRLMITSRKLTENEIAYLHEQLYYPITTKIAYDALAFIINRSNPDSLIRYDAIKNIFLGKSSKWRQINPKSKLNDIKVVFDNPGSNNVQMIMKKFNISGSLPNYCYAVSNNSQVIDYVENHPNAMGILSVNWISDPQDSISHMFLKKIRVVLVTSEYDSDGSEFYSPHPGYIANNSYPFVREVYTISRETFSGLGTGFIAFVTHDQGQRIVLRSGMVPATEPVRLIEIKKN
jgi:phosphate transport system substrate-binding protein